MQGLACRAFVCTSASSSPKTSRRGETTSEWMRFDSFSGVRGFVGIGMMGGPSWVSIGSGSGVVGTFLAAIRGGVLIGPHELAVEAAPFTDLIALSPATPVFEANATYGYRIKLHSSGGVTVTYPLRIGGGLLAGGSNTAGRIYPQLRADVVGLGIVVGHVAIDLHAPSFRWSFVEGSAICTSSLQGTICGSTPLYHILTWDFGATASYVF
jgi:hypothetical protein